VLLYQIPFSFLLLILVNLSRFLRSLQNSESSHHSLLPHQIDMAPPSRPTSNDHFFSKHQIPILGGTFALQVGHYQYIRQTSPMLEVPTSFRNFTFPRPLRAGLGWAAVFVGLLTRITLAKKRIRDYSDPIIALKHQKKHWIPKSQEKI
jgi:hypothetical protein